MTQSEYKGYSIRHRMGRFDLFEGDRQIPAKGQYFNSEEAAKRWVDESERVNELFDPRPLREQDREREAKRPKSATQKLIELAEGLTPSGEIGDGTVARFHELAAIARFELRSFTDWIVE